MASKIKSIADGFVEDLSKLLSTFASRNTLEFSDFAEIFRELHFACIFKGRPDMNELSQFINEMYVITCKFLFVESFHMNVGAVFTLYALYGLQPEDCRIPIRIESKHFEAFTRLKQEAIANKYSSLNYVLDHLKKNAFMYVLNQTLKGPLIRDEPNKMEVTDTVPDLMNTYQDNFRNYHKRNHITVLKNLKEKYMAEKKKIAKYNILPEDKEGSQVWADMLNKMEAVINPSLHMRSTIGSRRAKLREKAFKGGSQDDDNDMDLDALEEEEAAYVPEKKTVSRRTKRIPKEERKVGRPSRKAKKPPPSPEEKEPENEIDISHLLEEQINLYYPIMNSELKNLRSKRNPYYEDSPVDKRVRPKTRAEPEATVTSNMEEDVDTPDMPNLI